MNSSNPAEIALTRILQENPYPTTATNESLHHRNTTTATSQSFFPNRKSTQNDPSNNKPIPFYILPCLNFGTGERGRSNVKSIFALLFVPLFLLFFFVLDDMGRSISKNLKVRSNVSYLTGTSKSHTAISQNVIFTRETINVYPRVQRTVFVHQPEMTLQIHGETVEATMKCPRGILFLFHGCGRRAASFYYSPQGRRMINIANEAGMIVVAVEKNDELSCWDSLRDLEAVHAISKKFLKSRVKSCVTEEEGGMTVYPPIFGVGISSGATFVEELASQMTSMREKYEPFVFEGVNLQIMGPTPGRRWGIPTLFTVMKGDERTKSVVEESIPMLKAESEVPFQVLTTSGKKAITNLHFAFVFGDDNQMTPELSTAIYRDLVGYGILDTSGALKENPRNRKTDIDIIWQKVLNDRIEANGGGVTPFGVSKKLMQRLTKEELEDANSIWLIEELNVAWDQHEVTAEHFEEVITFFLDNVSSKREAVQAQPEQLIPQS